MTTLQSYFDNVFVSKVLAEAHDNTRRKYRASVRHANDFAGRVVTLAELSDKFIADLSAHLTAGGMSKAMVTTHRQHLRSIAADAQQRGHATGWISSVDPLANNVGGNRRQKFKRDTRGPKAKTARLLAKAAALFANGQTMAEIAAELDTPKETIHKWKTRYRAVWDAAYEKATGAVIKFAKQEAHRRAEKMRQANYLQRATCADAALREQGAAIAVDDGDPDAGRTVRELIAEMNLERGWEPSTLAHYRSMLRRIERWSGRVLYCRDFASNWVNELLAECETSHLASASVRGFRVHILALWRAANEAGYCATEPRKIRRVTLIHKPPSAWLYDEVQQAVAAAARAKGCYEFGDCQVERSKLLRLAVRVFWDTGMRPCDVLPLRMTDVAADGLITLTQAKTGAWHVCKLHASTLALARNINRPPGGRLIPWGSSYEYLRLEFRERVFVPAGLTGSIKTFRKSSATDVELHNPGAGAVHLGHRLASSIAYAHYLDPRIAFKNRRMPTELTSDLPGHAEGGAA